MDTQTRFIQIRAVLGVPQSSSKLGQNKVKKEKHFETLTNKFLERGYPVEVVDDNLKKGLALDRTYPSQAVPVPTGTKVYANIYCHLQPTQPSFEKMAEQYFPYPSSRPQHG